MPMAAEPQPTRMRSSRVPLTTGGRSACTTTVEPLSIASSTASRLHSASRASQVTTPSFLLPPTR